MSARRKKTPGYVYALAVCVGALCVPLIILLASFIARPKQGGSLLAFAALAAVGHSALGALFGLAWPERTWRWGVWLCAGPALFVCFQTAAAWYFLGFVAVTLLPACLGAHAAGQAHLQSTTAERVRLTNSL
jgi:hypothetical protein